MMLCVCECIECWWSDDSFKRKTEREMLIGQFCRARSLVGITLIERQIIRKSKNNQKKNNNTISKHAIDGVYWYNIPFIWNIYIEYINILITNVMSP